MAAQKVSSRGQARICFGLEVPERLTVVLRNLKQTALVDQLRRKPLVLQHLSQQPPASSYLSSQVFHLG